MNRTRAFAGGAFLLAALAAAGDEGPRRPQDKPKRPDPARLLEQLDKNKDGFLDRSELPERMRERLEQLDRDKDGKLSREELEKAAGRPGQAAPGRPAEAATDGLFRLLDADGDGKLSREELQNAAKLLDQLDRNKDGRLEPRELPAGPRRGGGRPGEVITPAARGERLKDTLKVGDPAPDFTLPDPAGKSRVSLSAFRGKKPVVLVFASYT